MFSWLLRRLVSRFGKVNVPVVVVKIPAGPFVIPERGATFVVPERSATFTVV